MIAHNKGDVNTHLSTIRKSQKTGKKPIKNRLLLGGSEKYGAFAFFAISYLTALFGFDRIITSLAVIGLEKVSDQYLIDQFCHRLVLFLRFPV